MSSADPDSGHAALLDACTLIPIRLTTTLLWLAEAGLFEVLWSDAILDEVERNLPKVGISSEQAAPYRRSVRLLCPATRGLASRLGHPHRRPTPAGSGHRSPGAGPARRPARAGRDEPRRG